MRALPKHGRAWVKGPQNDFTHLYKQQQLLFTLKNFTVRKLLASSPGSRDKLHQHPLSTGLQSRHGGKNLPLSHPAHMFPVWAGNDPSSLEHMQ